MASELENRLRLILEEKLNGLKPENIKSGVNILGVEGNIVVGELTSEEYTTCVNLASMVLNDTPIMPDDNITINLNMKDTDHMYVENNVLFIEEVNE